ncbi:MAG: hypothetical protein M3177_02740 [Pseudomonadota bacterium]|nr:hypothetical protein [Pseudomonadota bacterium]
MAPAASLIELSRVLEETARILAEHAVAAGEGPRLGRVPPPPVLSAPLVRAIIAVRRMRRGYFPAAAGDPAWSLLLELYAAGLEGRTVSQTRLGADAGVAETTTIRLTRALLDAGHFTRRDDPADRRLVLLALSDEAAERMRAYLTLALESHPLLA